VNNQYNFYIFLPSKDQKKAEPIKGSAKGKKIMIGTS
jgi:hypothetical protein